MILQDYYKQKKKLIFDFVNEKGTKKPIVISLFNDLAFKEKSKVNFPLLMFKYNNVIWSTSSENEYKADVDFSVFIVLNSSFESDYLESFTIAKKVDTAILLHPTESELRKNKLAILNEETIEALIPNSSFKIREGQYTVQDDNWEKNEYYIWEINYKTTLIEKEYKKKYTMVSNGAFVESELKDKEKKEEIRRSLRALGYNLDDYYELEHNGKKLLVYKEIQEKVNINNQKELIIK